jgi:anti-sigma regulatory factor (Ser/Thr protein kinase)
MVRPGIDAKAVHPKVKGAATLRTSAMTLPHVPSSATRARRALVDHLGHSGIPDDTVDDAEIAISELVGNAVRHARPRADGSLIARWQIDVDNLRIDVVDGGSENAPELHVSTDDESFGRGLAIVAALAREWGVERDAAGTRVWACFCW